MFGNQRASRLGIHCCDDMRRQVEQACDEGATSVVRYSAVFREYGLPICDDGSSAFRFCPWCGIRLPASLRDEWRAEMERQGIDPWESEAPAEFQSAAWWQQRHAEPGNAPDRG
jgi:hypothetical protein